MAPGSNVKGVSGQTKHGDHATSWSGDMVGHGRNGDRKPVLGKYVKISTEIREKKTYGERYAQRRGDIARRF
jgi:hypothetical protein